MSVTLPPGLQELVAALAAQSSDLYVILSLLNSCHAQGYGKKVCAVCSCDDAQSCTMNPSSSASWQGSVTVTIKATA